VAPRPLGLSGLHYIGCVLARTDLAERAPAPLPPWRAYAGASAVCVAAALGVAPLDHLIDTASVVLVFMLAVVLSAARFGRGPALLAAGLSVVLLNLFFVPPRYSLAVADERFFFTFAVMLVVGLVVGQLTAGLRAQAQAAGEREQRMRSLYEVSRELGAALTVEQVAVAVARFAAQQLDAQATLWVIDRQDVLRPVGARPAPQADALAQRALHAGHPIGRGTAERPELPFVLLPLRATMAVRGVLLIQRRAAGEVAGERSSGASGDASADQQRLQLTCATLLAGALERIHYIEVAQASAVEVQGERLRNTLLAALSHDLRTPLASLVGLAESLRLTPPALARPHAEIADAIAASARRMSAMANNLLDMARLQSGAVRLDLQWQPLEEVVGTALAATAAALGRHRVQVALPGDLPWVRIDAVLMERVLVNLLENAAKFTPAGTLIEIGGDATPETVALQVRDQGPGLPAGREEDLFKKFERGEREGTTSGVGLGLALCRAIVIAHGGTIHAEPGQAGGARFVIRLPRGRPPAVPAAGEWQPAQAE
jgi:two-component system sensor histidine kinase KdpD